MSGYSATPLAKKLGIKHGFHVNLINAPDYYLSLFTDLPPNLLFGDQGGVRINFIHFFTKSEAEYIELLPSLKQQIKSKGVIWVSWSKKASKVPTDITEDIIRNYAIEIGLVDIKVCAVDETWSGLKLLIPLNNR